MIVVMVIVVLVVVVVLSDCQDVYDRGYRVSSVYEIQPEGAAQSDGVYCEMNNGSGWTLVQRRVDGSVSFKRDWRDYQHGFGGAYGEHWVGTETLHRLTTQRPCRLRVDLWDWDGDWCVSVSARHFGLDGCSVTHGRTVWYIVWDWDGARSFAEFDMFRVDSQHDKYRLHVRGYHGNAGAR